MTSIDSRFDHWLCERNILPENRWVVGLMIRAGNESQRAGKKRYFAIFYVFSATMTACFIVIPLAVGQSLFSLFFLCCYFETLKKNLVNLKRATFFTGIGFFYGFICFSQPEKRLKAFAQQEKESSCSSSESTVSSKDSTGNSEETMSSFSEEVGATETSAVSKKNKRTESSSSSEWDEEDVCTSSSGYGIRGISTEMKTIETRQKVKDVSAKENYGCWDYSSSFEYDSYSSEKRSPSKKQLKGGTSKENFDRRKAFIESAQRAPESLGGSHLSFSHIYVDLHGNLKAGVESPLFDCSTDSNPFLVKKKTSRYSGPALPSLPECKD